ncbi:hypothetical protein [Terasakiella sp. SH-1]|uniref:hypothetical protein n=1 Tax=Terasakiella sp. SH-1 TaxID=2560057 RepID=UPI001072F8CC|nr:hypothetical protein [Terasakiella sp. SH-1]
MTQPEIKFENDFETLTELMHTAEKERAAYISQLSASLFSGLVGVVKRVFSALSQSHGKTAQGC